MVFNYIAVLVLARAMMVAQGDHGGQSTSLHDKYSFSMVLNHDPSYVLHWSVDVTSREVSFAVNASSRGWVGLGISKTGQMIGSDVATAWIDDIGKAQLQDRFATQLALPSMDQSQDWTLVGGKAENRHIIVEMKRPFRTCDEQEDIEITTSTSYIVWSMNEDERPSSEEDLMRHTDKGSTAINFLGKLEQRTEPSDSMSFIMNTKNTEIPSSRTTYWCEVIRMPTDVRYIYKFAPSITEANKPLNFVHHMLLYQCPLITEDSPSELKTSSMPCGRSDPRVFNCRGTNVLAGWAIGGQDFFYPKDVAYRVGEGYSEEYALLEIHYDNPKELVGHMDSSGIEFFYTGSAPRHQAGAITLGHHVASNMIIPPGQKEYFIAGICSRECTGSFLPENGIRVFGGLLHTHLAGRALELRHYRETGRCGGLEQLPSLDQNLNYDVDYQQVNLYPKETEVLPNDTLALYCRYNTIGRDKVTLGGERINDEMCLTFIFYYPLQDLTICTSTPNTNTSYTPIERAIPQDFPNLLREDHLRNYGVDHGDNVSRILDQINWRNGIAEELQNSTLVKDFNQICLHDFGSDIFNPTMHQALDIKCPYSPEPLCSGEDKTASASSIYPQAFLGFIVGIVATYMHYYVV